MIVTGAETRYGLQAVPSLQAQHTRHCSPRLVRELGTTFIVIQADHVLPPSVLLDQR
jgi:hypothetical protein